MYIGIGDVSKSYPDNNTMIAHFENEEENCNLTCEIKNNGTQTDPVWSIENFMGRSERQIIVENGVLNFTISGDQRPLSESNYGNYLKIHNCSSRKLNGTKVYCGSHMNHTQVHFGIKVCGMFFDFMIMCWQLTMLLLSITDLPQVMESNITQVMEGTEKCKITVVSTNLMANSISWEKDGESVREGVDRFTITFNNITRADAGNYSVASSVVCHDDKTKPIAKQFALDVVCK